MNPLSNSSQIKVETPSEKLIAGFTLSKDGKSATRDVEVEGKKLVITVFFPEKVKQKEMEARLSGFNQAKLHAVAKYAILIGLGDPNKKVQSVNFTEDDKGQIKNVEKQLTDKSIKPVKLNYDDKLKNAQSSGKDKEKIDKLTLQRSLFYTINKTWNENHNPEAKKAENESEIKPELPARDPPKIPPKNALEESKSKAEEIVDNEEKDIPNLQIPDDESNVSDEELKELKEKEVENSE